MSAELVDVLARLLSIITFDRSQRLGEVCDSQRKANVAPIFKKVCKDDLGNYRPVSLISVPRENHGTSSLGTNLWHTKVEKVLGTVMDLPWVSHA